MAPVVEKAAATTGVSVVDLLVDDANTVASDLRITSIPTLIASFDGIETGRLIGAHSEESIYNFFATTRDGERQTRARVSAVTWTLRLAAGGALIVIGTTLASTPVWIIGALIASWGAISGLLR